MGLLLFDSSPGKQADSLAESLTEVVAESAIATVVSQRELRRRLRDVRWRNAVLLLNIGTEAELDALVDMRDLLSDRRLVVVLGKPSPASVTKAHRLYPRFIMQGAGRWDELLAVLERMGAGAPEEGPAPMSGVRCHDPT